MATANPASSSTPAIRRITPRLAFVPSASQVGVFYQTSPDECTCPDWTHRHVSNPAHRCQHMRRAFALFCANCGTEQVPVSGDVCAYCAAQLADARAYCGCGRGRRCVEPFGACALCLADEALGTLAPSPVQLHAMAVEHMPLRLVR